MNRSAAIKLSPLAGEASDYLGPATVIEVAGDAVVVELPAGDTARARMALAYPYQPEAGDVLLIIGKGEAHYVIGVLQGSGQTTLRFAGGVEVRAEGGPLRLGSDQEVIVEGPEVAVHAGKLRTIADSAVEKLGALVQQVRGLWSVRAREAESVIDEGSISRAKRAAILTDESMTINGKQIHLG